MKYFTLYDAIGLVGVTTLACALGRNEVVAAVFDALPKLDDESERVDLRNWDRTKDHVVAGNVSAILITRRARRDEELCKEAGTAIERAILPDLKSALWMD